MAFAKLVTITFHVSLFSHALEVDFRNRAQVRDAGRVPSGLVSRFRQALLDGSIWLARLPGRGKFWGFTGALALKWDAVFQSLVLDWTCSGFTSVRFVLFHNCPRLHLVLSSLPCGLVFLSEVGVFNRFSPAADYARYHLWSCVPRRNNCYRHNFLHCGTRV